MQKPSRIIFRGTLSLPTKFTVMRFVHRTKIPESLVGPDAHSLLLGSCCASVVPAFYPLCEIGYDNCLPEGRKKDDLFLGTDPSPSGQDDNRGKDKLAEHEFVLPGHRFFARGSSMTV